jgi:arginyl-tRNA synthetase
MHDILTVLSNEITAAANKAGYSLNATVTSSDRVELGDFQCNSALSVAQSLGLTPMHVAEAIVQNLTSTTFSSVSAAPPGFINLTLSPDFLQSFVRNALDMPSLGIASQHPEYILVDYGGFNIGKPLHVGHARSSLVGNSLCRIFSFLGHRVEGDVHLGDWGAQMGMVIQGIKRRHPDLAYFDTSHTGSYPPLPMSSAEIDAIYPEEAALCKVDPAAKAAAAQATHDLQLGVPGLTALWEAFVAISSTSAKQDMEALNITFDYWYGESKYQQACAEIVALAKANGIAIESEGATIIPLENLPPLILVKSDGAFLYATTDLATLHDRAGMGYNRILYEVDDRQSLHFQQIFSAAKKLSLFPSPVQLVHIGHGTMNGPDGKPFKSRSGKPVLLRDLWQLALAAAQAKASDLPAEEREEICILVAQSSLKFADLKNNRASSYAFESERFTAAEGKTGPYLLYTAVRMQSILSKAGQLPHFSSLGITPAEQLLLLSLSKLSAAILRSAQQYAPHHIAEAVYEICQNYNSFYHQHPILQEPRAAQQAHWLWLTETTLSYTRTGLQLLGINIPSRM